MHLLLPALEPYCFLAFVPAAVFAELLPLPATIPVSALLLLRGAGACSGPGHGRGHRAHPFDWRFDWRI